MTQHYNPVRYFMEIGNDTCTKSFEFGPEIPNEVIPGTTQDLVDAWRATIGEHLAKTLQVQQEKDDTLEFIRWWIEDDHGVEIESHDVLTFTV